jgi:hypothetical protein
MNRNRLLSKTLNLFFCDILSMKNNLWEKIIRLAKLMLFSSFISPKRIKSQNNETDNLTRQDLRDFNS